ncbi:MAG: 16S rRNA (guanine(527)-N(7))-methyltransferase RsmG [Candidatus Latescibacterota bacterium]
MKPDILFSSVLSSGAFRYGLSLSTQSLSLFQRYAELLSSWNTRMNLVSSRDMERFVEYHLLDSLKIVSVFDFPSVSRMLDFGSGAGLPGIPLAIVFPASHITLLDSREKRVRFLEEAIRSLPLPNASVLRSRIEDIPSSFSGAFEVVTTRATVCLSDFFHLASPLLSPGGSLISIKGEFIEEEYELLVKAVDDHLFHIHCVTPVTVPGVRTGQVVIITKRQVINNTPSKGDIA